MALSDSEWRAWLAQEDKQPVILVEAQYYDGSVKTAYWSDSGYIDPTDASGKNYLPVIVSEVVINESLQSSVLDDVEVFLYDQDLLSWRFVGYSFKVWFGDKSWPRSDFVLQATEKTHDLAARDPDRVRFQFADLGDIYFDQLVNGNGLGLDAGLPFVFGRVFNFEPLRTGSETFRYFTPAEIASPEAARDNGVAVTITNINFTADGTGDGLRIDVTLSAPPAGRVTLDIRGGIPGDPDPTWTNNNLKHLLQRMNNYIQIPIPLGPTLDTAPMDDLGYAFYQYGTVKQMLTEFCDSLGLNPRINKAGQLDVIRIDDSGTATRLATDSNLLSRLTLQSIEPPYKQLELGYRKNWAVQGTDTLAGSVSAANALLYSRDYSYEKETRTLTGYPFVRNQKRETLLYEQTDAAAELTRRWDLRETEHRVYAGEGDASFLADEIGDKIVLRSADYGFGPVGSSPGTSVIVISNKKNLTRQRCQFEIWV
ncbi:hypothetical protein [Pseudohongiella spirulinae]|uniref:Tip attachment protein J domain-containing protein n=1 Tax=Pseudohongiella spirulinae TaxID=1249552 RepID=A0A0S2KEB1_9GAMM|nr:hypothetical protein [Pseudohongiella spirulinae]ALO46569.1 hypothetical protein PS2015_1922 [Pseudohongiella spirulinae]